MKPQKELFSIYKTRVVPRLKFYFQERNSIRVKVILVACPVAITLVILLRNYLHVVKPEQLFGAAIILIALVEAHYWSRYRKKFKREIISKCLSDAFPNFKYKVKGDLILSEFKNTGLVNSSVNIFHCEDQLTGEIEKTDFKISEVLAQYKSSGKNKSTRTIFRGFILELDFNKHFKSHTVITPDFAVSFFGEWFGEKLNNITIGKLKKVKLENTSFEKKFTVVTSDQQEARYLLSPKLMERIMKMRKRNPSIRLSFYKKRLYITFSQNKNFFEPRRWGHIFPLKDLWEINRVILSIPKLVETLDLNTRIWTKE